MKGVGTPSPPPLPQGEREQGEGRVEGKLHARAAVVTGASRQVGVAIAEALAADGAAVMLQYLKGREGAEAAVRRIRGDGGRARIAQADVRDPASVTTLVNETVKAYGRLDIFVHNARAAIVRAPFDETPWEVYQEQLDVTVRGAVHAVQAATPEMTRQGGGRIVFVLSGLYRDPVKGYAAFATAQAAVVGLSRTLALELGPSGITVNVVVAGFTVTTKTPHAPPRIQADLAQKTPRRRLAQPGDVAKAVAFLAAQDVITGLALVVDGGAGLVRG